MQPTSKEEKGKKLSDDGKGVGLSLRSKPAILRSCIQRKPQGRSEIQIRDTSNPCNLATGIA